ncbi:signal peptidase II [Poriferisphaera sp. WC338]|uniref:signal peptidase II n=1 Tax=Poriferisphaera sp. WC338 TaxID=3425129 RepID=UPI003D8168D1
MNDQADTNANHQASSSHTEDQPASTEALAWRSSRAVILFLIVAAVLLTADLLIKYYSFKDVGDYPVVIQPVDEPAPADAGAYRFTDNGKDIIINVYTDAAQPIPQSAEGITIIPHLLNLHITLNTGAVFGLGKGGRPVFIGVTAIALFVIGLFFARSKASAWAFHLGLACILAGALGNLYDRIVYSAVRDMFHLLPTTGWYPWIFNLADAALLLGVFIIIIHSYRADKPSQPQQPS